mmetsp:Transcript_39510/g.45369  ORF Transcript_39510/g.45369 Transcript_39510/m.45369 type:complete len:220 (-) Transcript_39510:14-673(-)
MYLTPVVIIIGLLYLCVGAYFTKVSVFITVLATTVFVVLVVMYGILLSFSTPEWVGWIILPAAVVVGLVIASLLSTFLKVGVFLVGCWAGGMFATCLFEMFVYKISDLALVLWIMIGVFALILGIISLKFLKLVMIIGTSFIGSYLAVRGISFYLGGYPNEFEMYNEIEVGDLDNVPITMYLYVAAMVMLSALGILFQYKRFKICSRSKRNGEYIKVDD